MNRPRTAFRNPLIRRIWRHRTVATMLRSVLPEAEIRPRVQYTTQPRVYRYPEENLLVDTNEFELMEAGQENLPGEQIPEFVHEQPEEIPPPISTGIASEHLPSARPDLETSPDNTNMPTLPSVQAKTQEKAGGGWRLPAVLRKLFKGRSAEEATQTPVDDTRLRNKPPSSPPPCIEKAQERQIVPVQPRVQAYPAETASKNLELEQPPLIKQTPAPSTPLARAVIPPQPVSPMNVAAPSTLRATSAKERVPPPPTDVAPGKEEEERNWRRLQTILRKHEEKQAADETQLSQNPPTAEEEKPSSQVLPESLPTKPSSTAPDLSGTSEKPIQRTPQPSGKKSASIVEVPSGSTLPKEKRPAKRLTKTEPPILPPKEQLNATQPENSVTDLPVHPPVIPGIERDVQPPSGQDTERFPQSPPVSEQDTSQTMPLPLEAVWPVQRKETLPTATQPAAVEPPSEPPLLESAPLSPDAEDRLRQAVQKTKTGQPTDSSVEVILPRSPRPPTNPMVVPTIPGIVPPLSEDQADDSPGDMEELLPPSQPPAEDYRKVSEEPQGSKQVTAILPPVQRRDDGTGNTSTTLKGITEKQASSQSPANPVIQTTPESQTSARLRALPSFQAVPAQLHPSISQAPRTLQTASTRQTPSTSPISSALETALPTQVTPVLQAKPVPQATPATQIRSVTETASASQTVISRPASYTLESTATIQAVPVTSVASPMKVEPFSKSKPIPRGKPAAPPANIQLIPTEIGSLPSDLWQLIGQPPPVQPAPPINTATPLTAANVQASFQENRYPLQQALGYTPANDVFPAVIQGESPPVSRTVATDTLPSYPEQASQIVAQKIADVEKPAVPSKRDEGSTQGVIQRQAGQDQTTTPENQTPPGGEGTSQQAPALSDAELDKLARQVYDEIRQKLSIERERTRGWMG